MEQTKKHMPLFTTFKRENFNPIVAMVIRVAVAITAILVSLVITTLITGQNIVDITKVLFEGATSQPWRLLLDTCILLGFGVAIVPVFKMKYWNMGANGQVLMGALAADYIMYKFAKYFIGNNITILLIMLAASILFSVIWAVIPAIFKVLFNTNETLFTLMMNYIASGLVVYVNLKLTNGKKESPGIINQFGATKGVGWFPTFIDKYFLPSLIIILITVFIYFYVSKTKHGYEVTVLGDSYNTAKYVGMKNGWIIIRTLILSGVITGIIGFLYVSAINHSLSGSTGGSLGFTGVLVAWLSSFNPIIMAVVSGLLAFLTLGTSNITSTYRLGSNNLSNIIIGFIFFSILISEFFIKYRLKINIDFKKLKNKFKTLFKKKETNKEGK